MKYNRVLLCGLAMTLAVTSGCGIIRKKQPANPASGAAVTPTPEAQPTAAPVMVTPVPTSTPAPRMIGTKTTQSKYVFLTNGTSQALREVYMRESGAEDWGKNMVASESTVKSSETVQMFYAAPSTDGLQYDLRIVDKSGNSYAIYGVPLGDMASASFQVDDGTPALHYTSLSSNSAVVTESSAVLAKNYGSENSSGDEEQWDVILDTSGDAANGENPNSAAGEGGEIDYKNAPAPTNYDPAADYSAYEGNPNYGYYTEGGTWISYY